MSISEVVVKKYNTAILNLFEIILSLDETQQHTLLKYAKNLFLSEKRVGDRKSCQIPIYYATEDHAYTGYIDNISPSGLFIKTRKSLPVGNEILMTFRMRGLKKPIKINGEIAHSSPAGLGVKFRKTSPNLIKVIKILVDRMDA